MDKLKTLDVLNQLTAFVLSLPNGTPEVRITAYSGDITARAKDADNIEYTFEVKWPEKDGEA